MNAVENELYTREKPHKGYLTEKLDSINWNVQVLMRMCELEKSITISEDIQVVLNKVIEEIFNNCNGKDKEGKNWDNDLFPVTEWDDLWLVEDTARTNKGELLEHSLNKLVFIDNIICMKENEGKYPIKEETHKEYIDILNVLVDMMEKAE